MRRTFQFRALDGLLGTADDPTLALSSQIIDAASGLSLGALQNTQHAAGGIIDGQGKDFTGANLAGTHTHLGAPDPLYHVQKEFREITHEAFMLQLDEPAEEELRYTALILPMKGIFTRLFRYPGETEDDITVSPFTPIDSLGSTDKVETVEFIIPKGQRTSQIIELIPDPNIEGIDDLYVVTQKRIVPVELSSDLNNDGEINSADNTLRAKVFEGEVTEEMKDNGTELFFVNDKLSNGLGDIEDRNAPAGTTDDDDVQEINVSLGTKLGTVDFDHPAIAKLRFYEDKACKVQVAFPFDLAAKKLSKILYIRAEGEFDGQVEGDLVLKYKPTGNVEKIEIVKLMVTVVDRVGDVKYFHAARDYMEETNSKLCLRQEKIEGAQYVGDWRLVMMLHENTEMRVVETFHRPTKLWGIDQVVNAYGNFDVAINANFCFSSDRLFGKRPKIGAMTDRCEGILISGGRQSVAGTSNNGDGYAGPKAEYISWKIGEGIDIQTGIVPTKPVVHSEALGGFSSQLESANSGWHPWYGIGVSGGKKVFFVATPFPLSGGGNGRELKQKLMRSGVPLLPGGGPQEIQCVSGDGGSSLALAYRLEANPLTVYLKGSKHKAPENKVLRQQGDYWINTYLAFKTKKVRK